MPPSLSRPTSTGGPTCPSWVIATQDQVSYCGSLRFATRGFRTRELLLPSGCQAWVVPGRAIEPIRVGVTYFWAPCTQMGLLTPWEKSFLYPRVRTIFYSAVRLLPPPYKSASDYIVSLIYVILISTPFHLFQEQCPKWEFAFCS